MICDVAHAHNDAPQGTMAIVASNMTLYIMFMSKAETPANVDTINAHGGCAGCHPKLLNEHIERLMSGHGLDNKSNTDNLKKMVDGTRV
eukprot:3985644-Ditylum_brightwellii.AAC.1